MIVFPVLVNCFIVLGLLQTLVVLLLAVRFLSSRGRREPGNESSPLPDSPAALFKALLADNRDDASRVAADVGRHANEHPEAAIALSTLIRENAGLGRLTATWALRQVLLAHPRFIELLAADPSPPVRRTVARAAVTRLTTLSRDSTEATRMLSVCQAALHDADGDVREAVCSALVELRDARALAMLTLALSDPLEGVQVAAAAALGAIGTTQACLALSKGLLAAGPSLGQAILDSLARMVAPAPQEWSEWLSAPDSAQCLVALRCQGALSGGEGSVHVISTFLDHPNPAFRRAAASALSETFRRTGSYGTQVVNRLIERLDVESDAAVLAAIAHALASSGNSDVAPALLGKIAVTTRETRERLLEAVALLDLVRTAARYRRKDLSAEHGFTRVD